MSTEVDAPADKAWFKEVSESFPGQCFSLEIEKVIAKEKTEFQDLLLFENAEHGKVLVLDGMIQFTERDECAYQEMMAFLPLNSHACPKNVLIIGGGDGGVAREVAKHTDVKRVVQCEIDQRVVDICKKHVPSMACGFDSPKVTLHICDGVEFLRNNKDKFDIIITDSSDPDGPAAALFEKPFYELLKSNLTDEGILCSQGECMWLPKDREVISEVMQFCRSMFPCVDYAVTQVPTYTTGQIGFFLCSKNPATKFREPLRHFTDELADEMKLKYYNEDVHRGAFCLPRFVQKVIHGTNGK